MDLFAFDLQLFADVEIDLAGAGVDGKNLYASINGAAATWMTSTEYQEVITSGGTVLVLAGLQQKNVKISEYVSVDKTLSIIADNGQSIQIKAASAGNAALKGYHVQLVQNVNESGVPVDELPKFNTCSIEYIDNENVGIASADFSPLYDGTSVYMYFDSQNVGRVEVGEGVTYNGISKVPPRDEPATFEIDPETSDVTLFSGYVSTKDRTVRINGLSDVTFTPYERTYDGADPEFNGTVSVGLGSAYLNGDPEQVVPVYRVFNATVVNESGKDFTFENDTTQITIPASWDTPFHVFHDHGRYLSGFAPGFSFTWKKESTDGDNCTCTVADDGKTMVITGDKVSVYTLNPSALDTLEFGHYGYAYFNDLEPLQLNLKLEYASAETGTTFYALDKTGKVWLCVDGSGNPLNAAPTISGDVIGYFKVVTAWNDGAPEVKVTFAGKALAEGATESDVPSYFGKVKVNATAVAKISNGGTSRPLTRLAVAGISRGKSYIDDSQISVVGLASSAITDYVGSVSSLLDWNGVNYFKVDFDSDNASTIGEVSDPWLALYGIFLEVNSTKANGVVTIKSTRFVQTARDKYGNFVRDANGNYVLSEIKSSLGLKWLYLDAEGLNGVTFPSGKHPAQKVIIRNAAKGGVFTGLKDTDAIEFSGENGTFTVNNKACSFQDGKITAGGKTLIPAGGDEAPVVCVDGTVVKGTFTLDKNHTSLTASAVPKDKEDTVSRDITYTGSGEGVKVVVKMNGYNTGGEIDAVMDMHDGEKVVVKNYRGKVGTKNETTTIEKKDGVITKTYDSVYLPMPITMTSTTTDKTVDLLSWRSFEMETRFDFGATTAGSIGLFEADKYGNLTIAAQPEGQKIGPCGEKKNYVRVLAQQSGSTYTISDLEIMVFNDKNNPDKNWQEWERDQLTHYFNEDHYVISIEAPTDGNLTLGRNAIELDTDRQARDEYGYPKYDENEKPVYVEDHRPSLFVTNAQGGKSYTGFTEYDSIMGNIAAGQTIKVGSYTYTAGADCTVSIRGDGKGVSRGTLYIPKDGLHFANSSITGPTNAIVQLGPTSPEESMTAVKKIMGLKAGQKVTVSTKLGPEYNYKIYKTEVYEAKAVTNSTALEIMYTRKEYNQTKEIKKYKVPGSSANILTDVTVKSSFDWTKPEDSYFLSDGYFLVQGLTAESTDLGTVEVAPTAATISAADAGSYYLKATLASEGKISKFTLEKIDAAGQPVTDTEKFPALTGGTLNITAPAAVGLQLDRTAAGLPDAVTVNIIGAAKDSEISNLRAGDSLKTAALAVGDTVTVNGNKYSAAAAGFLKFEDGTKLAEGTLRFTKDTEAKAITTTTGTYTVSVTAEKETAIVKVLDGKVAAISGLTDGSVTVTDGLGNEAVYTKSGVVYTPEKLKTGTLATASLKAGQTVTIDGTTYTTGANGAMKFDVDAAEADGAKAKVIEGTLELTKDGPFTSTGEGAVTYNAEDDSETAKNNVLITVRNGKVVSVTGLKKGDTLTVAAVKVPNADGSGFETKQVVYKAVSDTVVTKTVGDGAPITTYLSAAGGDVVGARYIVEGADVSAGANALTGQFSWTYASSRSTSFFALSSRKTAAIGEQAASVSVAAAKGKKATYVMANTALDASFVPKTAQYRYVLTLGAIQVSNDGGVTKVSSVDAGLLDGATVTINAPTVAIPSTTKVKSGGEDTKVVTPALSYTKTKDDNYHIVLNKVAKRSIINGLEAGDAVTTATLEAGQIITLGSSTLGSSVRYTAATKGALKFIGEGKNSDGTNKATLLSGTIRLYKEGEETYYKANISGATNSMDDDVKVTASGLAEGEYVTVKVENGVVKSITGLRTEGATVKITQNGKEVTYRVVSTYEAWNKPGLYDTIIMRTEGTTTTYASFTSDKNIYADSSKKNGYGIPSEKPVPANTAELWTKNGKKTSFVAWDAPTLAQKPGADITPTPAEASNWYVAATTDTKNGVTTIKKLEMAHFNGSGELKAISGKLPDDIIIDGTINAEEKEYAKLSYDTLKGINVTVINAGLGSDFKNIKAGDKISSADTGEAGYTLSNGKVTIYKYSGGKQTMQTITHAKGDKVNIVAAGGQVTKIMGLDKAGESVTIVEGGTTTIYTMGSDSVMTKTVITQDGAKKVYTSTGGTVLDGVVGASFVGAPAIGEVVSDFDWTTAKNRTGYFAVSDGNATAKAQKSPVKIKNGDGNKYIAVTISADGIVQGISQKVFDEATEDGMKATDDQFTGTLTIKAPTKTALTFGRSALDATIDGTAKVNITDAISDSVITGFVYGDKVTTAKLKVGESIKVNGGVFTAGAANQQFSLEMKNVKTQDVAVVTGGTIALAGNSAYVGATPKLITATNGKITVTANTDGTYTVGNLKEGESFTVKDATTGETTTYKRSVSALFRQTTKDDVTTTSIYTGKTGASVTGKDLESANWLTCEDKNLTFNYNDTVATDLVSGNVVKVDLATLDKRIKADKAEPGGAANSYDFVIDKYMAKPKDFKGAASVIQDSNFLNGVHVWIGAVWSKYVYHANNTMAQTIQATNGWTVEGSVFGDAITGAAKGSDTLIGGAGNDTLTGGGANDTFVFDFTSDVYKSGQDTVKNYTSGKDKIVVGTDSGYGNYDVGAAVDLDNIELIATKVGNKSTADVLLHDGTYTGKDEEGNILATNSVLVSGVGNGKAVTINNKTYFFGSAVETKGKTPGMTFAYAEGAYYLGSGNTAKGNTISVGTDKNKAAAKVLGDAVEVDLSDTTHYRNIGTVDASKSGNALVLTASGVGSTLKGGTYQSILKAGSGQDSLVGGAKGNDLFWFDTVEKDDAVSGYASGKDSVYLGDIAKDGDGKIVAAHTNATKINDMTIAASKSGDVVISNGDTGSVTLQKAVSATKAITVRADGEGKKDALSYYVGKVGTYSKTGALTKRGANTFTATIGKEAELDKTEAKNLSLKTNYYVGNDDADDTLKIVGVDTPDPADKTKKKKLAVTAKVSLKDLATNLSSIDILDASGLTKAAGSKITLEGKTTGDSTLKGSTLAAIAETFIVSSTGKTTVQNFTAKTDKTVGDVIELGEGLSLQDAGGQDGKNVVFTLSNGGKLQIDGVQLKNLVTDTSGVVTKISRSKSK